MSKNSYLETKFIRLVLTLNSNKGIAKSASEWSLISQGESSFSSKAQTSAYLNILWMLGYITIVQVKESRSKMYMVNNSIPLADYQKYLKTEIDE